MNAYLEAQGTRTLTYIPRAPEPDDLSDAETVPFDYRHYRSNLSYLWYVLRKRRDIRYAHLHLRNVVMLAGLWLKWLDLPYVVTCHAAIGEPTGWRGRFQARSYTRALSRATAVIFISNFVRADTFRKLGLVDLPAPHTVIHNGSERPAGPVPSRAGSSLRIVVVGELTSRKGIEDLPGVVDLIRSLRGEDQPPVTISVYGNGPLEPVVRSLAERASGKVAVRYEGYSDKPGDIFGPADLHLILARDEAFGRVVTEAMSYGLPTLALRAGAFPELITDGHDGLLACTVEDAAKMIATFDQAQLARLGRQALRTYEERFTIERSCAATVAFIERHLQG